jgi:hypothetical protein
MKYATIPVDFGIAVRTQALSDKGIPVSKIIEIFEVDQPLDTGDGVVTFGPHFGQEACDNLQVMLEALGLVEIDDFFAFSMLVPPWCDFSVRSNEHDKTAFQVG